MANERWLKKADTPPVKNVSQSDVRRIQQEKQARLAAVENLPIAPENTKTTLGGLRPPKTTQAIESAAPMRDFHKVANSISREAVPAGLFPGSSKKLYDAIYMRTRGAVVPVKRIQATRRELSKWSGIKNIKTVASHLRHLTTVGLLIHGWERGSTEGSTYEVRLPEEIGLGWSKPTLAPLSPPEAVLDQRSVLPLDQRSDLGGLSQVADSATISVTSKTSFKTKEENLDDEATRQFLEIFRQAERELTGKASTSADKWNELAELLVTELKIAAGRTTVSNVPAFLTEHLRRRLWKVDKKRATEIAAVEPEQGSQSTLSDEEKRSCPDCAGTNFWYPQGPDKGVAKCRHAKLIATSVEKQ